MTTKVRGSQSVSDIVCLRLKSYMKEDDPLLTDGVKKQLDAVRHKIELEQLARDSQRLQSLVELKNKEMHGNLEAALNVIQVEANTVLQQQDHEVMNWCRDKGWLNDEEKQWQVLAMIQRGLIINSTGEFLTCAHHKKQMHGFDECLKHFTFYKNYHLEEQPSIPVLAENIKNDHFDASTGYASVLERYFGGL